MFQSRIPATEARSLLFVVVALFFTVSAAAQFSNVDPAFNAVPSSPLTSPSTLQQVVQPDGKVVVFSIKGVVDGVAKADVFRINVDGSLDHTFDYCGCALGHVTSLMLAPGGKMIVAGGEGNGAKMIRLNTDGSVDPTFLATPSGPPPFLGGAEFTANAVQPDGKVLTTLRSSTMGFVAYYLDRYNADGSVDSGFPRISLTAGSPMWAFVRIELLPDGRFYMALTSGITGTGASLTRRNPNGSLDPTWENPSFQTGFPPAVNISDIAVTPDGGLLVAGKWDTVNGVNRQNLIRLQTGGNVDLAFNSPTLVQVGGGVELLPDGKILLSGRVDISGINRVFRLNSDGTPDNTFTMDAAVTSILNSWVVDSSGRMIFLGQTASGPQLLRLLPTGVRDGGFNTDIGLYGQVYASVVQTDGKVLLAGTFSRMNGVSRNTFARVNADGSLDPTLNPGTGFSSPPTAIVLQSDGKILAIGPFGTYDGTSVPGLVRINTDGTVDNSFAVFVSSNPLGIAVQSDGQILIVGSFATVNGAPRTGVARLSMVDGSLDNSFNPIIGSPSIRAVYPQGDGKIVIGGSFSGVNGFNRSNLARLGSDGSLDQTFTATGTSIVHGISKQTDGKYVITTGSNPTAIARRNVDGSPDPGFTPPVITLSSSSTETAIHSVLLQPDGSILVGGRFDTVGSMTRRHITRLAPNGTLDVLFAPKGADNRVRTLSQYSPDKVIVGGDFTVIAGVSKSGNARMNIAPYRVKTPFDFNGDGRADYAVYRPSSGVWYELFSNFDPYAAPRFGLLGDIPAPADFDGDGITDEAIFRPASGDWWYWSSVTGGHVYARYGLNGDIPRPGDFDGDSKADLILYRPSTHLWYRYGSSAGPQTAFDFGLPGDQPVLGDFDGDGKVDMAIFRPSTGDWWYAASSAGNAFRSVHWGATGDIPAPADYDGDGKTDYAVFRPSNGGWYVTRSSDLSYFIVGFGLDGDRPVSADYDGDGKADVAVFRPSTGVWYVLLSTSGVTGVQWGVSTDVAVPNAFLPQ